MIDMTTKYLGFKLKSPIVASGSPLCESIDNLRRMEDAGIAAVVLPSLFEEQLEIESESIDFNLSQGDESFPESLSYFPDLHSYNLGPDGYLELIRNAKKAISIPVIASLNGTSLGGWLRYARLMQQAGADAIELNLYGVAVDPERNAGEIEQEYCEIVSNVKAGVTVPVAVKLSPFFTALPHLVRCLDESGANALVLFNRFYQPEFDLETLDVVPTITLSSPQELLLRLHWVAIIYGQVRANLAVTGGVHRAGDVLKCIMAGASVAMMTAALLREGIEHVRVVLQQVRKWMEEHEYQSIHEMRGSMSHRSVPNPSALQRLNYVRVLSSYSIR